MASTSSLDRTKLSTTMPVFNGLNYYKLADAIKSFMWYNLVWFLIKAYSSIATTKQPGMLCPMLATNSSNAAEFTAWDEKNNKALGTILLYMAPNLKHYVDKAYIALEAWNTLAAEYEKPKAVGIFVAFQKLFNAQLSNSLALGPQIDAVIKVVNQVNNTGIKVK
jgi:hypothetical protein